MHVSGRIIFNLFVSEIRYDDVLIPTQSFPSELFLKLRFFLINAFPYNTALKELNRNFLICATFPAPSRKKRCPLPCRAQRFTWTQVQHPCPAATVGPATEITAAQQTLNFCLCHWSLTSTWWSVPSYYKVKKTLTEVLSCYATYCSPVAKLS